MLKCHCPLRIRTCCLVNQHIGVHGMFSDIFGITGISEDHDFTTCPRLGHVVGGDDGFATGEGNSFTVHELLEDRTRRDVKVSLELFHKEPAPSLLLLNDIAKAEDRMLDGHCFDGEERVIEAVKAAIAIIP